MKRTNAQTQCDKIRQTVVGVVDKNWNDTKIMACYTRCGRILVCKEKRKKLFIIAITDNLSLNGIIRDCLERNIFFTKCVTCFFYILAYMKSYLTSCNLVTQIFNSFIPYCSSYLLLKKRNTLANA